MRLRGERCRAVAQARVIFALVRYLAGVTGSGGRGALCAGRGVPGFLEVVAASA